MAPRNNDAGTSFTNKKKNFPANESENESDVGSIVSSLLHKKHKVIKMVKSQLKKIQEDGLLDDSTSLLSASDPALAEKADNAEKGRASDAQKSLPSERPSRFTSFGADTIHPITSDGSDAQIADDFGEARGSRAFSSAREKDSQGMSTVRDSRAISNARSSQGISTLRESQGFSSARESQGLSSARESEGQEPSVLDAREREEKKKTFAYRCCSLLLYLLGLLLLIFLIVWISAGPLSNSKPRTPITTSSFVGTDGLCALEKKYLLRWSQPQYFE